ncbi:MAG: sensor histidine kinase [Solirubrobacteraceae bacterium]
MAISRPHQPDGSSARTAALDRALALIDRSPFGTAISESARSAAGARAAALLNACGETPGATALAAVAHATELLSPIAVQLAAEPERTQMLVEALEADAAVPRVALGRELLRSGGPAQAGIGAVDTRLGLLRAFTGAAAASLWSAGEDGEDGEDGVDREPRCLAHSGELASDRSEAVGLARTVLAAARDAGAGEGGTRSPSDPELALRIDPAHHPAVALVIRGIPAGSQGAQLLAGEAAPTIARLLNRGSLVGGRRAERSAAEATERRLARLRFDLHDGPQQDVHLLAQDLRLFRDQLTPLLADDPDRDRALGRLDDLEAQLVALDGDLRRLSTRSGSPVLSGGSLEQSLAPLVEAFAQRTGVTPAAELTGNLLNLTDSQQIAVLALVREALSNVRRHSGAEHVSISVAGDETAVTVRVSDDGAGFDPEAARVSAARAGRLGLVGMHERLRMLGGRTEIKSRPGGPTVISATLPRWPPDEA